MAYAGADLSTYTLIGGVKVHPVLIKLVEDDICPGTGFSPTYFWSCLEQLVTELSPEVKRCLARRDELQQQIDEFYQHSKQVGTGLKSAEFQGLYSSFVKKIGYLVPDNGPVNITTQFVDSELALIPGPQLVCPVDSARFVLNAINARWGSLFDALYSFDVIPVTAMQESHQGSGFNPIRGEAVVEFANNLLDEIAPLATGKWSEVTRLWPNFIGSSQQLVCLLQSGENTGLKHPSLFVGSTGSLGPPSGHNQTASQIRPSVSDRGRIILRHNGLHLMLEIDHDHPVGKTSLSGIKDIMMESALSTILDMEDSVAAVDAADKAAIYANVNKVFRGSLSAPIVKDGKQSTRTMNDDIWFRDDRDMAKMLPGRVVCLVRNVGHHMFTDAVVTADGAPVPEGFLDCLITVASALHDLRGTANVYNSRTGSVYIVKPKMHGPEEVALTTRLFRRSEEFFGLQLNTVKMGIMDEERRTSINLRECIRAASDRVFFINTGFLDRTGDEIHTCMVAGPIVRKADIRQESWIKAYENSNVDIGMLSGFQGKAQIGKGMWAKPDSMKAMLEAKIGELNSGASTAWCPSPAAATLHSIHYHRVDVLARQAQLTMRPRTQVEAIMEPPFLLQELTKEDRIHELRENAQSILGYVVRWIDMGVGCSKVPDLSNVGLMEDRATLRISSQLLANWILHGLITEKELRDVFAEMAGLVDQQNARDKSYKPMLRNLDENVAFQAALTLCLQGLTSPNGYTEPILHEARRKMKSSLSASALSRL